MNRLTVALTLACLPKARKRVPKHAAEVVLWPWSPSLDARQQERAA